MTNPPIKKQCDQLWRNYADLAKIKNTFPVLKGYTWYFCKFKLTLANLICY